VEVSGGSQWFDWLRTKTRSATRLLRDSQFDSLTPEVWKLIAVGNAHGKASRVPGTTLKGSNHYWTLSGSVVLIGSLPWALPTAI